MSEADHSNLGHVIKRWDNILLAWKDLEPAFPQVNWTRCTTILQTRRGTQTTTENLAAWALDPSTMGHPIETGSAQEVVAFLQRHSPGLSDDERVELEV